MKNGNAIEGMRLCHRWIIDSGGQARARAVLDTGRQRTKNGGTSAGLAKIGDVVTMLVSQYNDPEGVYKKLLRGPIRLKTL